MLYLTIAVVALLVMATLVVLYRPWRCKSKKAMYSELRMQALTFSGRASGLSHGVQSSQAWGVMMELGSSVGVATLISLSDGSASLYYSNGGGVIGGIAHESIRNAAKQFVSVAGQYQSKMSTTTTFPLPAAGRVVFYVRTDSGVLTAEAGENELGERRHVLSPLFYAGHGVITAFRTTGLIG
ncbi:MAG: hypothetical protein ABSE73_04125 [Planctomycetota bacterium]